MAYEKRAKRYIIEYRLGNGKWTRSNIEDKKAFATKEEAQAALASANVGSSLLYHVRTK